MTTHSGQDCFAGSPKENPPARTGGFDRLLRALRSHRLQNCSFGAVWRINIHPGICALAELKFSIATPAKQQAALSDEVIEVCENALAKADKLDVEEPPDKKTLRSIAIVPPEAALKPEKATKIISRHWQ